jgi:hypothetical protein
MMTISDTQRQILAAAAQHAARLAIAPHGLPAAARNAVFRSMLKRNLLAEITAPAEYAGLGWRQDEAGTWIALRVTDAGLQTIGEDAADGSSGPSTETMPALARSESPAAAAPSSVGDSGERAESPGALSTGQHEASGRPSLRDAARALLVAWDANDGVALAPAVATLRAALPSRLAAPRTTAPRQPRQGTKQEAVLALLRRPDGATVAQIAEATGWANHTVRGFFAGLKKRQGIAVEVLERVRQVGPNKQGAKGSYTIYRIAEAG